MYNILSKQSHPYHLVEQNYWPFVMSVTLIDVILNIVLWINRYEMSGWIVLSSTLLLVGCIVFWWLDVIREGTIYGSHTSFVRKGLSSGFLWFLLTEVLVFAGVFWGYLDAAISPNVELGMIWPPIGVITINAWELPFLNTVLLLSSGAFVTWSHHGIINNDREKIMKGIWMCLTLILIFTIFQLLEYKWAPFTLSDGVYGSVFYAGTGLHGFHVLIGTVFLGVILVRLYNYTLTARHHLGLEIAILYAHFVDVVWLLLFCVFYYWGA